MILNTSLTVTNLLLLSEYLYKAVSSIPGSIPENAAAPPAFHREALLHFP
jgi:hypothetical protein